MIVSKDWASYKKGDEINIIDKTVLKAGIESGLFIEKPKKKTNKANKK